VLDLDGDARLELVVASVDDAGFYQSQSGGLWSAFHPLRGWPPDFSAPGLPLADMSDTGCANLASFEEHVMSRYPSAGEEGFGTPATRPNNQGLPNSPWRRRLRS
jgi:hypothetical protein